jgi:ceramide glucosyltransferase
MLFREIILIFALGPLVYYLMTLWVCVSHFRRRTPAAHGPSGYSPPISILKPVRGLDRGAYENFASFCEQDYPEYEVLFCVSSRSDPSAEVIERLQSSYPERRIQLLFGGFPAGTSDKLNNLCRLVKEARYGLLVISDSDIRVEPNYLREVAAAFADPEVGAVTVLFRSVIDGALGPRLDAAGSGVDFASRALLAERLEGIRFTLGFTMATTKRRLAEIGGFEAFASHYVDDYELGRRVAQHGHRVELAGTIVSMVYSHETLSEFLRHELRWMIGLRSVRPAGHAAMGFTFGLPWTIFAVATAPSTTLAETYVLAYLLLRFAVSVTVGVWGLKDTVVKGNWWLAPLRELANFGVWVASFCTNRISWRGTDFRIESGILVPLGESQRQEVLSSAKNTSPVPIEDGEQGFATQARIETDLRVR